MYLHGARAEAAMQSVTQVLLKHRCCGDHLAICRAATVHQLSVLAGASWSALWRTESHLLDTLWCSITISRPSEGHLMVGNQSSVVGSADFDSVSCVS